MPCPPPGDLPNPGIKLRSPAFPAWGCPDGSVVKNPPANVGDRSGEVSVPGLGRPPGAGKGNPLQYSYLENPMDKGAWRATDHGVAKSQTRLSDFYFPRWLSGKESACQCRRCKFNPWVRKIPWRRKGQSTPLFLPEKSHGQRSLAGYSS